jgi:hypothetical protein
MKTIELNTQLTGIRAKVDRSLGLTLATPELSPAEKAYFMELQGVNLETSFKPIEEPVTELVKIDKDITNKTPSQRFRAVLFLLWKQMGCHKDFESFYRTEYEKIIDHYKNKLNEESYGVI